MPLARTVIALATVFALGACGLTIPVASNVSVAPGEAAIAEAQRVRTQYGLRADREYVATLLSDNQAVERGSRSDYGLPLTAAELDELGRRAQDEQDVVDAIEGYGRDFSDDWAGLYVEPTTRTVVAQFAGDVRRHREALGGLLNPKARFRVEAVFFSLAELQQLADRLYDDRAWLTSIGASYQGSGVDVLANRAALRVLTLNPEAETLIRSHFSDDARLLVVIIPGGEWAGGRGDLVVIVQHADGRPAENLTCVLVPDVPAAWGEDIRATGDTGRCAFNRVGATGVDVFIEDGDRVIVGRGRALVRPGDTITLKITVAS